MCEMNCVKDDGFFTCFHIHIKREHVGTLVLMIILMYGIYFWEVCCEEKLWRSDVIIHIIVLCGFRKKNNFGGLVWLQEKLL